MELIMLLCRLWCKQLTEDEFNQWVAQQAKVNDQYANVANQPAASPNNNVTAELMSLGKQKYEQICVCLP